MKIYLQDTTSRFANRLDKWIDSIDARDPNAREDYLLVAHPESVADWIKNCLPDFCSDEHCRGVLFVKGRPYSGVDLCTRNKILDMYGPDRIHFLSYAVDNTGLPHKNPSFNAFFSLVENNDLIDWSIIDEVWPQHLVAAYILARALLLFSDSTVGSDEQVALGQQANKISKAAKKECKAYNHSWELPQGPLQDDPGSWASKLAEYLVDIHTRA